MRIWKEDHPVNLESEIQLLQATVGCFNWIVQKKIFAVAQCVLCTKTKNNILELESSISSTFVAEHGVLKQLLCLTTSHYTKRTNRCYSVQAVCAAQKYLRGPAAPMRSSSSTVNKLPQTLGLCRCGLPFFVPIQMYCMFFAGLWFRHGEIRAKTRKKTNAKEKSRSFTL